MRPLVRKGLTGIETAIILIAIVLVAAAFAFIVLNMGFGVTQKAGEVITKGTEEAASSLEPAGTVLAIIDNKKEYIIIFVKAGVGAMPIDANKTAITFSVEEPPNKAIVFVKDTPDISQVKCDSSVIKSPIGKSYTVMACIVHGDDDNLIEVGEKWAFVINVTAIYGKTGIFEPYLRFRIELKPPAGATLPIERTLPATITPVMETW